MPLETETVTVHQRKSGKPVGGIAPVTTVDIVIAGCDVDPAGTTETLGNATPVTDRYKVITGTGDVQEAVTESDKVTWRGKEYAVLGEPQHYYDVLPHTEFLIVRVKG